MHRSDLKHTLMAKSRTEEQEKKAREELRVAAYELRMIEDELQIAREEGASCGLLRLDSRRTRKNCRWLVTSCISRP